MHVNNYCKRSIDNAIHSKMEILFAIVHTINIEIKLQLKKRVNVSKGTVCKAFFKALQSFHCASVLKL